MNYTYNIAQSSSYEAITFNFIEEELRTLKSSQNNKVLNKSNTIEFYINNIKYLYYGVSVIRNNIDISLFSSIYTLLTDNFLYLYDTKELDIIETFKLNTIKHINNFTKLTDTQLLKKLSSILNINIIEYIEDDLYKIYYEDEFYINRKFIIISKYNNYYYPIIKYINF